MSGALPPQVAAATRALEDSVQQARIRATQLRDAPLPQAAAADPRVLADAAAEPGADPNLKLIADAVARGKVTWTEVARGDWAEVPELHEVRREAFDEFLAHLDTQTETVTSAPAAPVPEDPDEDEYFTSLRFLDDPPSE